MLRVRRVHPLVLAAIAAVGWASVPRAARAFTCTLAVCDPRDKSCTSPRPTQVWKQRCIPFFISTSGSLLDSAEREDLVIQSFKVWSQNDCTDLEFRYMGRTDETDEWIPETPEANHNVIASIEEAYPDFDNDTRLLALTLTRYAIATGEIFDADILLNTSHHSFDDVADRQACSAGTRAFDLRNTLIHEMGHFIGFDHTPVNEATMFASADPCEITKRDLAQDDQTAVCTVYPKGGEARTCVQPESYTPSGVDPSAFRGQCERPTLPVSSGGACSCAGSEGAAGTWAIGAVLLGVMGAARRRRAREA